MVDYDYKVGDKFMLTNKYSYKYEPPYNGTFVITQCWTNGTVTLQYGVIQIKHNIRFIKPYTFDTNVEDITPKNMCDGITYDHQLYNSVLYIKTLIKGI